MRSAEPYQEILTESGGISPFGDPVFRLVWSLDWRERVSDGRQYRDYLPVQEPVWLLLKWEPSEWWGSRPEWEMNNAEWGGLFTAGEYPAHGRYRILRKLERVQVRDGFMQKVPLTLCGPVVSQLVPMIRGFLELTAQQKARMATERIQAEQDKAHKDFARSRDSYRISRSSVLVKNREEKLERWASTYANVVRAHQLRPN